MSTSPKTGHLTTNQFRQIQSVNTDENPLFSMDINELRHQDILQDITHSGTPEQIARMQCMENSGQIKNGEIITDVDELEKLAEYENVAITESHGQIFKCHVALNIVNPNAYIDVIKEDASQLTLINWYLLFIERLVVYSCIPTQLENKQTKIKALKKEIKQLTQTKRDALKDFQEQILEKKLELMKLSRDVE